MRVETKKGESGHSITELQGFLGSPTEEQVGTKDDPSETNLNKFGGGEIQTFPPSDKYLPSLEHHRKIYARKQTKKMMGKRELSNGTEYERGRKAEKEIHWG